MNVEGSPIWENESYGSKDSKSDSGCEDYYSILTRFDNVFKDENNTETVNEDTSCLTVRTSNVKPFKTTESNLSKKEIPKIDTKNTERELIIKKMKKNKKVMTVLNLRGIFTSGKILNNILYKYPSFVKKENLTKIKEDPNLRDEWDTIN